MALESWDSLERRVNEWRLDRGLTASNNVTPVTQLGKVQEEVEEAIQEWGHILSGGGNMEYVKEELGDVLVASLVSCFVAGVDPRDALQSALVKIEKRDGVVVDGVFVKSKGQ